MKLTITDILFIAILFILIVILVLIIYVSTIDAGKCISNPLKYSEEYFGAVCSCFKLP